MTMRLQGRGPARVARALGPRGGLGRCTLPIAFPFNVGADG